MAERTSGVIVTGASKCGPPWTTRCPTTSISDAEAMTRAFPSRNVRSKCPITCSREETGNSSFRTTPCEFFTVIAAVSTLHSILPSHSGGGRMHRKCGSNFVQAGLLATGTRVEHEYFHKRLSAHSVHTVAFLFTCNCSACETAACASSIRTGLGSRSTQHQADTVWPGRSNPPTPHTRSG
jgi:hypothetical protein